MKQFDYELKVSCKVFKRLSRLFKKYGLPFEYELAGKGEYLFKYMEGPICENEHFDTILRDYINIFHN